MVNRRKSNNHRTKEEKRTGNKPGRPEGSKNNLGLMKHNPFNLSEKQKLFCEKYIECHNVVDAAAYAEYKVPDDAGYRLIKNEKVKNYIANLKNQTKEELQIGVEKQIMDLERIKQGYIEALNIVNQDEPLTNEDEKKLGHLKDMVKARDLNEAVRIQSELLGLYDDKMNVQQNIQINIGGVDNNNNDEDDGIIDATIEDNPDDDNNG